MDVARDRCVIKSINEMDISSHASVISIPPSLSLSVCVYMDADKSALQQITAIQFVTRIFLFFSPKHPFYTQVSNEKSFSLATQHNIS